MVQKKFNSGWSKIQGPIKDNQETPIINGYEYSDPEFSWERPVAVTSIHFIQSSLFPEYENSVLVGSFLGGILYKFELNENRDGFRFDSDQLKDLVLDNEDNPSEIIFGTGFAGITDIKEGPDGSIYIVTIGDGKIFRISPGLNVNISGSDCQNFSDSKNFSGCIFSGEDFIGKNFSNKNFKLDKLSSRLSKVQADNQLRFKQLESNSSISQDQNSSITSIPESDINNSNKTLPGSTKPQDLGSISYEDMTNKSKTQTIQSVDSTKTVVTEIFESEEKILPKVTPKEQYEFATSFLKVGDYNMAERAFREFVETNPDHKLSGNAQYWYAETFRIRQLYTDAASAYLEGYQKYPKSEKAPINLLKLGVSLVQIGEKDQGCLMIAGVKKQYPEATQSVLQKAKYEEKKFECKKENS